MEKQEIKRIKVLDWHIATNVKYVELLNELKGIHEKKGMEYIREQIEQIKSLNILLLHESEKMIVPHIKESLVTLYLVDWYDDGGFGEVLQVIKNDTGVFVEVKFW